MNAAPAWRPTTSHLRVVATALGLTAIGVLFRRPDLLVLATPLVCIAVWSVARRPTAPPSVSHVLGQATVREGQVVSRSVVIDGGAGAEDVVVAFDPPPRAEQRPIDGRLAVDLSDLGLGSARVETRITRWGRHRFPPPLVALSGAWNGYRYAWNDASDPNDLLALPEPTAFDAVAPAVHAPGLIGRNRSPRAGSGTEFAAIRPFQPGDRLRRIHWPTSVRANQLHVSTTFADHDRHVALLVDAFEDIGVSDGIDGAASSLDIEVRAAAAIAEHYIRAGDRVALTTMGARRHRRLPPGVGDRHLRRLLATLATIEPSQALVDDGRVPSRLGSGSLVVVVSPLVSPGSALRLTSIADRGLDVIAIDCLPIDLHRQFDDPYTEIAWRLEHLERAQRLRRLARAGIAVVPWRGPGSLDQVLRALYRRSNVRVGGR